MDALESQADIVKALLVQCGGSAYISRASLDRAMRLEIDAKADEKGITLRATDSKPLPK
jgi:hypothetical protein